MATTQVKIKPQSLKFALLKEGYGTIKEFCEKAKMSTSTVTAAMKNGECSYGTAFKIMDELGIEAEEFVVTE